MQEILTKTSNSIVVEKNGRTILYERDDYGFLSQVAPEPFKYTLGYKARQGTNVEMVNLRIRWLRQHIEDFKTFSAVDIGAGNMVFVKEAAKHFKSLVPFDLAGETISEFELYNAFWDIIFMTDVLEHFDDITDLFKIKFKYAFISFPETPDFDSEQLAQYRHFKPDEHIWMLNCEGFCRWAVDHGCEVVATGCPEDTIRTRWDKDRVNITSVILRMSNNLTKGIL